MRICINNFLNKQTNKQTNKINNFYLIEGDGEYCKVGVVVCVGCNFFSSFYWGFWFYNPDSFIVNSELNIHPFHEVNGFMWGDEEHHYKFRNDISLVRIKEEYDNYIIEQHENHKNIDIINDDIEKIGIEYDELYEIRNSEYDERKKIYERDSLASFVLREREMEREVAVLEKKIPQDFDSLLRLQGKRVDLAGLKVKRAHQEYLVSEYISNNSGLFISEETHNRFVALEERVDELYEKRGRLNTKIRDSRSVALRKHQNNLNEYRKKLNYWDFFYFSIGISTTTTFGDIVANDRGVRGVVSFQLILCVFIIGGFVNSVVAARRPRISIENK